MLGRQAKIVSPATLQRMLAYAQRTRQPKRDAVIVLLSVKAGLRACEIAGLQWPMVMTDKGGIGDVIDIRNAIAKRGSGRRIPMHPDLQRALAELWCVRTSDNHIVASNHGGPMRANSIVNWFVAMFADLRRTRDQSRLTSRRWLGVSPSSSVGWSRSIGGRRAAERPAGCRRRGARSWRRPSGMRRAAVEAEEAKHEVTIWWRSCYFR